MTVTRLLDQDRPAIAFTVDGEEIGARQGDTLLTAILAAGLGAVRLSEFGDGPRAGFCWMGACQDCWVVVEGRGPRRACTTLAEPGMVVARR
ncbi:(2Fe-2S)-binding protein [Falsiroseomonas sp. CW058]|uniref:(2Fe-2S)-binding protein n=1 Tax=Falsiroseomonas sp. CW058 TaxID=3388664 RepID=UPI003D30F917